MKRTHIKVGAASAIALAATLATPAVAAGTQSGTTITNDVTVNYKVGNVAQTASTASDTFTVDQKVNLTVIDTDGVTTQVTPGQVSAVTSFTVTNNSNDTIDIGLVATQQAGSSAVHDASKNDTFDGSNVRYYIDSNANGTLDAGDTQLTTPYLDEVAPDTSVKVLVVVDIPVQNASGLNLTTGDIAVVTLEGQARAGGTAGSQGAVLTQTAGANTAGVDTVFADTVTTDGNVARDGKALARDDFTVKAAALTVTKTSLIVSDPLNGATNPKAIPGATIQYCIRVDNAAGSATATALAISDTVPATLTAPTGIVVKGAVALPADACSATNSGTGSASGQLVSGTLPDLDGGYSAALVFQTTIK